LFGFRKQKRELPKKANIAFVIGDLPQNAVNLKKD
jgi:hypothetical protein